MNHYLYWPEGLLIACSVMTIAWLWQWKHDHPAIVDVVWSYLTPALAVGWIFLEPEALWTRKLLIAVPVSYTHLRAHETSLHLVCRLLLEKKNN